MPTVFKLGRSECCNLGPPDSMVINIATFSETSPPQTSSFGLEPSVLNLLFVEFGS